MEPYYERDGIAIYNCDCREVVGFLDAMVIDSIVTDPPYGLEFMGKEWDHGVPGEHFWDLLKVVCKPGAMMLAFGGTRKFHRLACAIEDAGWEIRDCINWLYGSGFPKSLDISKAIDKAAGAEREVVAANKNADRYPNGPGGVGFHGGVGQYAQASRPPSPLTSPTTEAAQLWNGWGTALKPAWEPIIVAMKPLDGTFAQNALKHGVAGIAVDRSRVPLNGDYKCGANGRPSQTGLGDNYEPDSANQHSEVGRFPANVIHDGSDEVLAGFPQQTSGANPARRGSPKLRNAYGEFEGQEECVAARGAESGSASRFFKCCQPDNYCQLCDCVLTPKHDIMTPSENKEGDSCNKQNANHAERSLVSIQAIIESIAQGNVHSNLVEKVARRVPCAEILCDSCATRIALVLVKIKNSDSRSEESHPILDSIGSCKASILTQNLVSFAELWENIDTIPTTRSLSILCGSVLHAIESSTRKDEKVRVEEGSVQVKATRFRYVPKASSSERGSRPSKDQPLFGESDPGFTNTHPTVKPLALMKYLLQLVSTPTGGIVLDPFMGSGSTLVAAKALGRKAIGIEISREYCDIAIARLSATISPN